MYNSLYADLKMNYCLNMYEFLLGVNTERIPFVLLEILKYTHIVKAHN